MPVFTHDGVSLRYDAVGTGPPVLLLHAWTTNRGFWVRQVEALRDKFAARLAAIEDRIRRAEQVVAREKGQASSQRMQTAVSFGATLLTAVLGRKAISQSTLGRATTAARGVGRAAREEQDVARAQEDLAGLERKRDELAREMETELANLSAAATANAEALTSRVVRPRKADIEVMRVALLWGRGGSTP